jgi:Ca2+-binding EF-hand superfamily protein
LLAWCFICVVSYYNGRIALQYGEKMSDDEVKLLIEEADVNHDGKLDYQEVSVAVIIVTLLQYIGE